MSRYDFNAQRLFVDAPLRAGADAPLSREQANYILNVLRLAHGDRVLIFNGRDGEWKAQVSATSRKSASLVAEDLIRPQTAAADLHYFFAPLKHARLDYMVQKAAEMGVACLAPVFTRRTQAGRVNLERMRANAIEAAEQCGILFVPEVAEPRKLEQVLADWPDDRLLIFCDEDAPIANPVEALRGAAARGFSKFALLIGPEGGFDDVERQMMARVEQSVVVSLGPRILRADTAAVAALALAQACLGDWRG